MKKKLMALCLCLCLGAGLLGGCAGGQSSTGASPTAAVTVTEAPTAEQFSDGDYKDVSAETPNATITLSGGEGTISDSTRGSSGSIVTITSKGIYRVTGSAEGVTILIDEENKSGNIYLVLDGVSMTNDGPCILVEAADKVIVQCVGENSLESTSADSAAIEAADDLTVNGSGSLTVISQKQGVVCKNDLKITGGTLMVVAGTVGLKAGDSVRIGGGSVTLEAGHDGIQIDSDDGDGYFVQEAGSLFITAGYDGIDVGGSASDYTGYLEIDGGSVEITAGGGAANSADSTSQKGLKCDGSIYLTGGTVNISSADDAVHADGDVSVTDGVLTLATSDDGIHADGTLSVSGGSVTVSKSYEGLEAENVLLSGGDISVTASDDGISAAGGSDSQSGEATPWGGSSTGTLTISGGTLYVNAEGDGLDSNGSIYVTGGTVIVEGPTNGGNGALDKGDGQSCVASITGGTVLALGSTEMAINFDSGSQCSALVSLSGSAGDVITVDDGSGLNFTATKSFACAVYSSPNLSQGQSYTLSAGDASAALDFLSGLYYSTVAGMTSGGTGGMPGGKQGR